MSFVAALLLAAPFVQPAQAIDSDPSEEVIRTTLRAAPQDDGSGWLYAYNGQNPGPTIRGRVGQILEVELINDLASPTTLHWHGMQVPFEMDGVPWLRDPVWPGERMVYRFELRAPGTFWYHPHFNTDQQLDGGLYGAIIVEDPEDEVAEHELVALVDQRIEFRDEALSTPDHGHAQFGVQWLINGAAAGALSAQAGDRIRLRIINASNTAYLDLDAIGASLVASDQGPLTAARPASGTIVGPGDRAELVLVVAEGSQVISTRGYSLNGGSTLEPAQPLLTVLGTGGASGQPIRINHPQRPRHEDPGYADIVWSFAGSDRSGQWFINGGRFPDVDMPTVALDSVVILELRNLSPTEHPFHIHGLVFEVLSRNGVAPEHLEIEDTINLKIRERVRLRIVADMAGDWMSHCHIIPHAEDGMMTVLRVE